MAPNVSTELLFRVQFTTGEPVRISGEAGRSRVIVPITGGTVGGPGLTGLVAGGEDWISKDGGRMKLDVRARLIAATGEAILMSYQGVNKRLADGSVSIVVSVVLEAPADSSYAWMNDTVCVGSGEIVDSGAQYSVFAIRN